MSDIMRRKIDFCKRHKRSLKKLSPLRSRRNLAPVYERLLKIAREQIGYAEKTNAVDIINGLIREAKSYD